MKKAIMLFGLFLAAFIFGGKTAQSQEKQFKAVTVAFYNLENLFDTVNDPNTDDEEFTPSGADKWDGTRYRTKLSHLAEVISRIGSDVVSGGPLILGVSEVENRKVVEDLVNTPPLRQKNYGVVHYDSPDKRGVDVAMIYRAPFKVISSKPVHYFRSDKKDWTTRDILVVEGEFDGEHLFVLVNHWPSRSSGQKETETLRIGAADLCRKIVDSILSVKENAKIIIMGDLNDDPKDISVARHLDAKPKKEPLQKNDLYNPMWKMFNDGIGSLAYRDAWNLFDQIIVSSALVAPATTGYHFYKAGIFDPDFLKQKEGQYAGYPYRTYAGSVYMGGYSDHFPAYIFIVREIK